MTQSGSEQVRRYYDDNTRLLLALGQGTEGTIHRAVWGPGVATRSRALAYVDELITAKVREFEQTHGRGAQVIDLGCGVGATLCKVAQSTEIQGTGVTISKRQVEIAQRRIEAAKLVGRVRCIEGDFLRLTRRAWEWRHRLRGRVLGPCDRCPSVLLGVRSRAETRGTSHCV